MLNDHMGLFPVCFLPERLWIRNDSFIVVGIFPRLSDENTWFTICLFTVYLILLYFDNED